MPALGMSHVAYCVRDMAKSLAFFRALGPATIGSMGTQVALFADTIIATFLPAGALHAGLPAWGWADNRTRRTHHACLPFSRYPTVPAATRPRRAERHLREVPHQFFGPPLAGAANASFLQKCEAEA